MRGSRKHVAVAGAIALLIAGFTAASSAPSASGQTGGGGGGGITAGEISGPVEPIAGWDGHEPTVSAAEAGIHATPVVPTDAQPAEAGAGAESVIGPDGRTRVTATTTYPNSAIGQIEFNQNGSDFICTGWLIDRNSLLTSGHCAFDPTPGGGDIIEFATFFPGRNGASNPFGGCAVSSVWAPPTEWRINGQPYYDFAVMNLDTGTPACDNLGNTTGTFGLFANANLNALNGVFATVTGFPGDQLFGTMWKMRGRIFKGQKRMLFYPMDTFAGQSGSPIWQNRTSGACTGTCGLGIHSYGVGLPGPGSSPPNNAGPRLTAFRLGQIADFADDNGV